jgi:diguanylate cyclase (GGDEF)-like protein
VGRRQARSDSADARGWFAPAARSGFAAGDGFAAGGTQLLDALPHPAFVVAVEGGESFRFVYANAAYRALLRHDDPRGDLRTVLPAPALVSHVRAFAQAVRERSPIGFEADWGESGLRRALAVDVTPVVDGGGACTHLVGAAYDITAQRLLEGELVHRSRHDPVTDLPNRVMLLEWLERAIERAPAGVHVALVVLDVDRFGVVNDTLGHTVGDELLTTIAARIDRVLRAGDRLARLGGDELAVVCHGVRRIEDAEAVARRIRDVFTEPFVLADGREVFLDASAGVAVSDESAATGAQMLRDADTAVFAAKERGRGRVEVFDAAMYRSARARLETEAGLRRALAQGEFRVHYQPLVQFARSEVIGFEALVRWHDPERGLVAPDEFLGVAEETGLIVPIGAWVLHDACAQAARWAAECGEGHQLVVAVNLSARQLADPDLVATVDAALAASGLDPALLVLEVTETALMDDRDRAVSTLRGLGERGVRVSIDDFGTGHSSLGYLKTLPVHTLKIDRSFVSGLGKDPDDSAIVAAVVQLAHALGLTVTAEGIEDATQLQELRALGCEFGQGYYFARPQPGDVVRALVHRRFRWALPGTTGAVDEPPHPPEQP